MLAELENPRRLVMPPLPRQSTKIAKVSEAVAETADGLSLGVDEDGAAQLLEVAPEESTKESLKWEQEHLAGENAREKETAEEKETPEQIRSKGVWQKLLQRPRQAP